MFPLRMSLSAWVKKILDELEAVTPEHLAELRRTEFREFQGSR